MPHSPPSPRPTNSTGPSPSELTVKGLSVRQVFERFSPDPREVKEAKEEGNNTSSPRPTPSASDAPRPKREE